MRYVFFGTPLFAAKILERLIDADIAPGVLVCNPDRPVGRKKAITPPPTKQVVINKGANIKIIQPANKNELSALSDELFSDNDFGVVAAYAQIIPQEVIDKARLGIIGVHPSLLPKLRGASPIQTAILEGHERTGVNLFMLDEKVDHGPILANESIQLTSDMDYKELEKRLADLGAQLLIETLPKFVMGKIETVPQDDAGATYTKKFITEDGYVSNEDLEKAKLGEGVNELLRKIKALNPEPGVYTEIEGKRTKLLDAEIADGKFILREIQIEGGRPVRLGSSRQNSGQAGPIRI